MNSELAFRIAFFLILVSMFSISTYFRKKARTEGGVIERKQEGIFVLILRMAAGLPLLFSLLFYIFSPGLLAWSTINLPVWLRTVFVLVAFTCIPLLIWVFRCIGSNISETVLIKEDHKMVSTGPYQWVRHPLYSTSLLMLFSFSIIAGNWFIFAYFAAALLVFRFLVIPQEEKRLIEAFGGEYQDYITRTGALIPRISPENS